MIGAIAAVVAVVLLFAGAIVWIVTDMREDS